MIASAALASAAPANTDSDAAVVIEATGEVVSKPVSKSPDTVRDYWTRARMRNAQPAELRLGAGGRIARPIAGALTPASAGSEQPARSAVDASATPSAFPDRVHGKVFFTISGGTVPGNFVCSGTVVSSNGHTLAWTAGHCVNDAEFGGGFATNWAFVPGYHNGERPFGTWVAEDLMTTRGWADNVNIRLDVGAALLERDGEGRGIEDVIGARGIAFNQEREQQFTAFGYPAQPSLLHPEFNGQLLFACASPLTASDDPPGSGPETIEIDCDMTSGSSGGGWVIEGGLVNSVTSYAYTGDFVHLYGPYLGTIAEDLHQEASGEPITCAGTEVTNLGGSGAEDFDGTTARDAFKLKYGADRASAEAGDDRACGGDGGDRLEGDDGNDELRGGDGKDMLIGGPGHDVCAGGDGKDQAKRCEQRKSIP